MRRGGVAKTYTTYKAEGMPFADESGKYYIEVSHPKTGKSKMVRWYSDKAHEGMHPVDYCDKVPDIFKRWGFETEDDYIWVIEKRWIREDEEEMFKNDPDWQACALFGPAYGSPDEWWKVGCRYAPKWAKLPEIAASMPMRYKKKSWREVVEEAYRRTKEEGVYNADDYWGVILEDLNNREVR